MPTPCDGKKRWNGNRNPATLVATVVTKKTAVQPSRRFAANSPNRTINPEKIPIRLNTTCTKVKVVIPKIIGPSFPLLWLPLVGAGEYATIAPRPAPAGRKYHGEERGSESCAAAG